MFLKRFKFLIFFLFLLHSNFLYSQTTEYVKLTTFSEKKVYSKSDTIKIALKILINEHLHINSYRVSDPTLIKTAVSTTSERFKLLNIFYPKDKKLKFEFSENEIDVYEGEVYVGMTFLPEPGLETGAYEIPFEFEFQACDNKVCFAPRTLSERISIQIGDVSAGEGSNSEIFANINFSEPTQDLDVSQEAVTSLKENERTESPDAGNDELSEYVEEHGIAGVLVLIFLGGLALNLTPCVYPLIPITVSFFGAQSSNSKTQSILMGVFYALGMSITYSALGVFAALTGSLLGTALQNPIVIISIALVLFALGTSMFGLFEIRVPQSLALMGNKNRSGYFGSVLMGLTVGFIAAPCIGPFVLSLLVYVGKLGNAFTGFLLFFVLSLGLGLPYIFLAASSSAISKLPRSGEWMEGVKVIFGLILFGMALNTIEPLIPKETFKVIFPLYIVLSGVYLILLDRKGKGSIVYQKIKYSIGIIAIVMGTWVLKPSESVEIVDWKMHSSLESIAGSIKSEGKPVMIDFYADWCAQCKELDAYTYTDPEVIELSKSLNNIKVDLTKENVDITNKYDIKGLPVVVFLGPDGEEFTDLRVTGFLKPEDFKKKISSLQKYISQ